MFITRRVSRFTVHAQTSHGTKTRLVEVSMASLTEKHVVTESTLWWMDVRGSESHLYVELTEEKVKNLVNFKCLFIECKCELGDNCRCETSVNGKRGGYMSERWLNKTTGNRVQIARRKRWRR